MGIWAWPGTSRRVATVQRYKPAAERYGGSISRVLLYLVPPSMHTISKLSRPPRGIATAIYVLTGMIYRVFSCKEALVNRSAPRSLPIWLDMLSLQYLSGDTVQRISPDTALLRWASCVFFVSSRYKGDDTSQQFLPSATTHIVSN